MSKDSKQRSFRRAFGAGAEAWERKDAEELTEAELSRAETDWNHKGNVVGYRTDSGEVSAPKRRAVWAISCGVLFILGLVWMVLSQGENRSEQSHKEILTPSEKVAEKLEEGGLVIGLIEEDVEVSAYAHKGKSLKELVSDFLKASSHEERLTYIVRPSEHGEAMKAFFEDEGRVKEELDSVFTRNTVSSNGVQYTRVGVWFKDGSKRLAPVVNTQAGRLIDFKAYSRACTVPLMELIEEGGACQYARVFVEPVSYYNGLFSDDKRYQSYLITSPDLEDTQIYGYVELGDPTAFALQQLLHAGVSPRMILHLESFENSHQLKQFHIEHVYCSGWVRAGLDVEVMINRRMNEALRGAQ